MRIVQITTDSRQHFGDYGRPEPYFGTAPAALFSGFESIDDLEVHVISCARKPAAAPERIGRNLHYHQPMIGRWGGGKTMFAGCVAAVRRLVKRIQPDVVHGQGTEKECAVSAVFSGKPSVVTLHGNMRVHARRPEHQRSSYYRMIAMLEGIAVRRARGVVAISSFTRDRIQSEARRLTLIPNAVDSRFFDIQPDRERIPRILSVGAIAPHKNPVKLIELCEPFLRGGRCTLAIAGKGNFDSNYGRRFKELTESVPGVSVLGFVSRDQLRDEFARSDLLVHPTMEDNCPMVILEAMAAGLPVAASAIGGVPDLVEHGVTGYLFDPQSRDDMHAAVDTLLTDRALREDMGRVARKAASERFEPESVARRHLSFYEALLAGS